MTPESATTWLDVLNAGGTVGVLVAIIVYGAKMLPKFIERWGEHTVALNGLKTEVTEMRQEIKELRDDIKRNK